MKLSKLEYIVLTESMRRKESAGASGSWGDGGSKDILDKFEKFKYRLVEEYDLRPSEISKLDDIEVEIPSEFSNIREIVDYKQSLSGEQKLLNLLLSLKSQNNLRFGVVTEFRYDESFAKGYDKAIEDVIKHLTPPTR
jgi:hypothetical protein